VSAYLEVIEVLAIHDLVIDEFGGSQGLRDLGALEAAVFRPQTGYYRDPIEEAAALLESLIQGHPFLDGNKRTAVACADVHLRMNGYALGGDSIVHYQFLIGLLARHELSRDRLDAWLRDSIEHH